MQRPDILYEDSLWVGREQNGCYLFFDKPEWITEKNLFDAGTKIGMLARSEASVFSSQLNADTPLCAKGLRVGESARIKLSFFRA